MYPKITVWILALLWCDPFGSVLSSLANSLSARQWGIMPVNSSLNAVTLLPTMMTWCDSGIWDPLNRKVRWVGGPGSCCANPADFKMLNYDEATDTWTRYDTPFSGNGHAFDGNALDPRTGLHYFARMVDPSINVWDGTSWSTFTPAPSDGVATTPCVEWWPDINNGRGGLFSSGMYGQSYWCDGARWHALPATPVNTYGFAQYNPVLKGVWYGGGLSHYFVDTLFRVRTFSAPPFALGSGEAVHSVDPVGGKHLVFQNSAKIWWEFDAESDAWKQITDMAPRFTFASAQMFQVPIPEYGVILVFNQSSSAKYVYLYKHTAFTASEKKAVSMKSGMELRVSPNPARGSVVLALDKAPAKGAWRLGLYAPDGKRIRGTSAGAAELRRGVAWNTAGMPAGVYLVKLESGGCSFIKRVALVQ